ncbi:ATP-binding protein (plasmid) [Myxococcus stipitatus]|uniref:TraG/VirB4 family ATPase n=1 Tax=Myxococcus stipitatus TaxID=83455 RepID=UPI0031455E52
MPLPPTFKEVPLAHVLPYWWVGDGGLVLTDGTVVLSYRMSTLSIITETDDVVNVLADKFRTVLNAIPHGFQLQILRQSRPVDDRLFREYREAFKSSNPILREQRAHNGLHLQSLGLRTFDTFFFLSWPKALAQRDGKKDFVSRLIDFVSKRGRKDDITRALHDETFDQLRQRAALLARSLASCGIVIEPLTDEQLVETIFKMVNPGTHRRVPTLTDARPPRELPDAERLLYRSLSLREQLVQSGASQNMDTLFLGEPLAPHRVLSLKALPKTTEAAMLRQANRLSFDHWLSVGISIPDSEAKFEEVDRRRKRAQSWAAQSAVNIKADEQAAELEKALRHMESRDQRVFNLSVQILFGARDVWELEQRTTQAVSVFGDFHTPVVTPRMVQLRAWTSMLPGAAHLAPNPRTVLTDNVAHMLPVYDAWQGDQKPVWLAATRNNEPLSIDLRDPRADAWNFSVFGRTGSGKSFFILSQLTSAMLGQGSPVVVIDVGGGEDGSYYRICQLVGGDFVDLSLDGKNAINPFLAHEDLFVTDDGRPSAAPNEGKFNFLLNLAVLACYDPGVTTRTRVGDRILRDAIVMTYARLGRARPPLFSDLADTLSHHYSGEDAADELLSRSFAKTLRAFLAGPAGKLLNQQTKVKLGSSFTVFDLKGLENLGDVATAMLYVVSSYVWNMIGKKDRTELAFVIYDETWKVTRHPTAAEIQEELYRTARKLRAGVVSITQKLEDFLNSPASKAVLSNTIRTFLLRHKDGHKTVADMLNLNEVELDLFKGLHTKKGYYSEVLMKTDSQSAVVRYSPSPWDYWVNTTDALDKELERKLLPQFGGDRLATVRHLVATYPNGASAGPVGSSSKVPHAA